MRLDVLETVERDEDDAEELTVDEVEVDLSVDVLVTDELVEGVAGATAPNSYICIKLANLTNITIQETLTSRMSPAPHFSVLSPGQLKLQFESSVMTLPVLIMSPQ